jgi:hypothetical protein
MATRYWVGTSGTAWNSSTTTGWSTSSGGAGGASAPTITDDVIFDVNSTGGSVNIFSTAVCKTLTTTGATITFANGMPTVHGDVTITSGVTVTASGPLIIAASSTVTFNPASNASGISFEGVGSTYDLASNFISTGSSSIFRINAGTVNTNNYNISVRQFTTSVTTTTRAVNLGTSTITVSGISINTWDTSVTTGLTLNSSNAAIVWSRASASVSTVAFGSGQTISSLQITAQAGGTTTNYNITGTGFTIGSFSSLRTNATVIRFDGGSSCTIGTWLVTGSSGNIVTINSSSATDTHTISVTNRTVSIDYLYLSNIRGGSLTPVTFYIGANSRLRGRCRGVAKIASVAGEYIHVLVPGTTSWLVPADFSIFDNSVHIFGAGGGGAGASGVGADKYGGAGGGGGGYTRLTNITIPPSTTISYFAASGGAAGTASTTGGASSGGSPSATTFNASAYSVNSGTGGTTNYNTSTNTGGSGGSGSTFNGGTGGIGGISTSPSSASSGGGGGAGGPLGVGKTGGAGGDNETGGGGAGNGGGTNGSDAPTSGSANGGNNASGAGGGTFTALAFDGGGGFGGNGTDQTGTVGSSGVDITDAGMGSGGGAGGSSSYSVSGTAGLGGIGGDMGGGGSGGSTGPDTTSADFGNGGAGGDGGIIILYTGSAGTVSSNFFFMYS